MDPVLVRQKCQEIVHLQECNIPSMKAEFNSFVGTLEPTRTKLPSLWKDYNNTLDRFPELYRRHLDILRHLEPVSGTNEQRHVHPYMPAPHIINVLSLKESQHALRSLHDHKHMIQSEIDLRLPNYARADIMQVWNEFKEANWEKECLAALDKLHHLQKRKVEILSVLQNGNADPRSEQQTSVKARKRLKIHEIYILG